MIEVVLAIRRAKLLSATALLALSLLARSAAAQQPPAPAEPTEQAPSKEAPAPSSEAETDKLVGELLGQVEGEQDDDLRWLYSDVEEYAPSDLVGKPIPAPGLPERGEGSRRVWNPSWRRFGVGNYIVTGITFAVASGSFLIPEAPDRWRGKNGVDEAVRDAISITDYEAGQWSRDISDLGLSVSIAYPLLVDSLVVMYWYRQSHDVAGQMALISLEALSITAAVQGLTSGFTSRERPYGRNCNDPDLVSLDDCSGSGRYRSFFSGHTALSFAGAAVSCSHHLHHELYGTTAADAISCTAGFLTAGVAGTMRIVGDRHYVSDVAGGAVIGTLGGLYIPWLLHYGTPKELRTNTGRALPVTVGVVPTPGGLGIGGTF